MQFIVAHIADDTAICDVIAVDINYLSKAVVIVEKIFALGIENIPYTVNIYDVCNVTVHTCVRPHKAALQTVIAA